MFKNTIQTNTDEIVNVVYKTTDYDKFNIIEDNRDINPKHVAKLAKAMDERGWEKGSYVVVDRNMNVFEGQHRVSSARIKGVPVFYIIEDGLDSNSISNLNRNQQQWKVTDHLNKFVKAGNPNYVALSEFMEEFSEFKATDQMMLTQNAYVMVDRDIFDSGMYKVKDMELARTWARQLMSLKPYFKDGYNKANFVRSMAFVMSKEPSFIFDEFLHKIKINRDLIHLCGDRRGYIQMIEEIYNYKRPNKNKLNLRML